MTHTTHRLVVALIALAAAAATAHAGGGEPGVDPIISDRAIVHVRPETTLAAFLAAFNADFDGVVTLAPIENLEPRPMYLLGVAWSDGPPTDLLLAEVGTALEENYLGILRSGEFLYENQAPEGKTGSIHVDGIDPGAYLSQYAHGRIGLPGAHARSTGAGSVIALLDTGMDATHPALAGRVAPGGWNFIDDDANVSDVGNEEDDDADGDVDEMTGHGTFVAGLLALTAPDARILPIKVLNGDGVGDGWILTKGLAYAIDHGVEIINLSLGSTYNTATVEWLIGDETPDEPGTPDEAFTRGIVVVSAAGNFNRSDPREFPAMGQGIGVAALDHLDIKADFSNFSPKLSLSAPGATADGAFDPAQAIVSTMPGGGYATWEGTSFAVPFVAGAAALVRAQHPEWLPNSGSASLIMSLLEASSQNIYPQNPAYADDESLGAGRLDAAAVAAMGPIAPVLGDIDADGIVGFGDLLMVLSEWGAVHSAADLNGDGVVGFDDVLVVLSRWG